MREKEEKAVNQAPLSQGAKVRLTGLKGAVHLNGALGVCTEWDDAAARWVVKLENGEQKSLTPENLVVEDVVEEQQGRMASDPESGFVCCPNEAAARQALGDGELRLEFGGVSNPEERSACIALICEVLGAENGSRPLRGLSFADCQLNAAELRTIAGAVGKGAGQLLAAFGISKNPGVDPEAWREIFSAIPPKVVWLDFGDNQLSDDAIAPLVERLAGKEELDKLYLDGNQLCDISSLCTVLSDTGITTLDLGDNAIGDDGAQRLARALRESVVMILSLGTNPIGPAGVLPIFEGLPRSSLDVLYLDNTGVDDACLDLLGIVLSESKLMELHIDNTRISEDGLLELIPCIGRSELNYIDISGNGVSEATSTKLEETVSAQRDVNEVDEENADNAHENLDANPEKSV